MFPTWRLRLREARMAWQSGRFDDASALLLTESLRDFLPAKRLAQGVAAKIVERAQDRFRRGNSLAGWQDLSTASLLGGDEREIARLKQQYLDTRLNEALLYLVAGQTDAAGQELQRLQSHGVADGRARVYGQLVQLVRDAHQAAARGHLAEASATLARAGQLAESSDPGIDTMTKVAQRLRDESNRLACQDADCQRLSAELHAALAAENWSAALVAADAILAIAPHHAAAGQARRRAWRAVGMDATLPCGPRRGAAFVSLAWNRAAGNVDRQSTRASRPSEVDTVAGNSQPQRALLWVDAVGGFLVCLDDCITLGQPSSGDQLAVPILADLSRRHAVIRRDGGAYVLEPLHATRVNGREIHGPFVLADDHVIELGDNVRLRFTKPHALSATARLTVESHHKTQPSADAVLLMADSCVLGPNRHCHVRCRDWERDIVIFRQGERLLCRAGEQVTCDGVSAAGECEIQSGARVEGEDFAFTWETMK